MKLAPSITAFVLFIALCISATYWTLQLIEAPQRMTAAPPLSDQRLPELGSAAGLLGGQSSFSVAGNIQLKGVVVAGEPSESVAILAINGQPALAVRTHTEAAPGITLQEVHKQHVLLTEGGVIKRVELPVAAALKVR